VLRHQSFETQPEAILDIGGGVSKVSGLAFAWSGSTTKEAAMATFVTIGYGDRAGYNQTDPSVRDAAHEHDDRLRAGGAVMGIAGQPVQVRNHNATGVETATGPYLRSDLPIAGFALIEAPSIEEAVALASGSPCAVAQGVVEVWPLESTQ
jgi:hypothetical protein